MASSSPFTYDSLIDTLMKSAGHTEPSAPFPQRKKATGGCKIRNLMHKQRQIEAELKVEIERSDVFLHSLEVFKGNKSEAYKSAFLYYVNNS